MACAGSPLADRLRFIVLCCVLGGGAAVVLPIWWGLHPLWSLPAVGGVMLLGVVTLTQSVLLPIEDALRRVEAAAREGERHALERVREVGEHTRITELARVARAVHRLGDAALRDRHEAERLKREGDAGAEAALRHATARLRGLADHDPLTGLLNRRAWAERLDALQSGSPGPAGEAATVHLRVTGLDAVNRRHGRAEGDRLLTAAAEVVAGVAGGRRNAARLDGATLALLLLDAPPHDAERLSREVASLVRDRLHAEGGRECNVEPHVEMREEEEEAERDVDQVVTRGISWVKATQPRVRRASGVRGR